MRTTRREFLQTSAAAGGALGLGLLACQGDGDTAPKPMRILFLGGTGFIGPHQVRYALKRGHEVTLFNRGRTNADLFPDVEKLIGDRDGELDALRGREWDAVIDNSGYVPRHVRDSAQLLKDAAGQYLFVSTLSVLADFTKHYQDEDAALAPLEEPGSEEVGKYYGPLKVLCEQAVQEAFADRATIFRPGLIVGPGDPTDRFTYWPVRIDRGGEVLAPGTPDDLVLVIDARDLGEFCIHAVEQGRGGVYNTVGPKDDLPLGRMLTEIRRGVGAEATFTYVDEAFLSEHEVAPWLDMPVWFPSTGDFAGFGTFKRDRAVAAGLTFRPLVDTARDTLEWFRSLPAERQAQLYPDEQPLEGRRPGLSVEREREVLEAWRARTA